MPSMTIRLDHTIVPALDKVAAAGFFAEIFGLKPGGGYFAQLQVNESLTRSWTRTSRWSAARPTDQTGARTDARLLAPHRPGSGRRIGHHLHV
jgi:hypothetical protein